tara:strand:- start:2572 stop:2772 length:201 start_codon:yes stop_codon:yes gene_type:complete
MQDIQDLQLTKEQIRQIFIDTEQNCSLCGSTLKLIHNVDYIKQEVEEQGKCPSCGVQSKKRNFVLQ